MTTTRTVAALLSEAGRSWTGAAPASKPEIAALEEAAGFTLPTEYVGLLRNCNGGEGELALAPRWFQLFDAAFATQLANDAFYRREFDGLFFFGSNGGLESIAFDMRGPSPWPIVMVDCIAGMESAEPIASDIAAFIEAIGIPAPEPGL